MNTVTCRNSNKFTCKVLVLQKHESLSRMLSIRILLEKIKVFHDKMSYTYYENFFFADCYVRLKWWKIPPNASHTGVMQQLIHMEYRR